MNSPAPQLDSSLVQFGTSSFSSKDWVGPFYPKAAAPGDFLQLYSQHFDTVEIDATYYATPPKKVIDGWKERTPQDFRFAAKFPRSIVHAGEGPQPDASKLLMPKHVDGQLDLFLETIGRLGSKLDVLLLQFPYFSRAAFPDLGAFMKRLDDFLDDLPTDFRYAIEIRNRAWLTPEFAHLCRAHDAVMVLVDQGWMPHGDEIEDRFDIVTSDRMYVRLLGDRKEIESITDQWDTEVIDRRERLRRWSQFLVRAVKRGTPTSVYVNNHYAGHAPATARRLQKMFADAVAKAD